MKVCVVGLGIMGSAIAKRLLAAQHVVFINNRSREKAEALVNQGAVWAATPAEAARDADVVITMVKDPEAVKAVTLGDSGILSSICSRAVHAEMSTVSPQSARELEKHYGDKGKHFVQAPVLGSRKQIEDATLLIMAGGKKIDVDKCQPVWCEFSKRTWQMESAEQAAALKLSCNMLIAQMILGLGQSLSLAKNYGVDLNIFLDVLDNSALSTAMYRSKGQSFINGNFQPNFTIENMLKDIKLAQQAAEAGDIKLPPNKLAEELFSIASEQGLSNEDYSAVIKVLLEK